MDETVFEIVFDPNTEWLFTKWLFIGGGRLHERVGCSHVILSCYILGAERLGEGGLVEMSQLKIMQIVLFQKAKYIYLYPIPPVKISSSYTLNPGKKCNHGLYVLKC